MARFTKPSLSSLRTPTWHQFAISPRRSNMRTTVSRFVASLPSFLQCNSGVHASGGAFVRSFGRTKFWGSSNQARLLQSKALNTEVLCGRRLRGVSVRGGGVYGSSKNQSFSVNSKSVRVVNARASSSLSALGGMFCNY